MMADDARQSAIVAALRPISDGLEADGYSVRVALEGDLLEVEIAAGPDACADCLVPDSVMRPMVQQLIGTVDGVSVLDLRIIYPTSH